MATVQTIATTLTADPRPFTRGVNVAKGSTEEFGKAFARLDAQTKRAGLSGGGLANDMTKVGGASSNASRGVLELSRGIEDFSTQFGTQGFAGGIRAASNNLSQLALTIGGPVAGAVAGFAAAGLTMAMPYIEGLFNATEQAKRFSEQLDIAIQKSRELFETRAKAAEAAIDFRAERAGLGTSNDVRSAAEKRQLELQKVGARLRELDEARARNRQLMAGAGGDLEAQFGAEGAAAARERIAKAEQEDFRLAGERLALLQRETELRVEIGQLRSDGLKLQQKEVELQRQKDQSEFAAGIRKMQEEDDRTAEQARKRRLSEEIRATGRSASFLEGELGRVSPEEARKRQLLDQRSLVLGSSLPDSAKVLASNLLMEMHNAAGSSSRGGESATAISANSQSLARAQDMARNAAKQEAIAKQQAESLAKVVELLRKIESELKEEAQTELDDVNLN